MAIVRVRTDDVHAVVYTGDPGVDAEDSKEWVAADSVRHDGTADVVRVRPLSGLDARKCVGVDGVNWGLVVDYGVAGCNGLKGSAAAADVKAFPFHPFTALANYIWGLTQPVAVEMTAEEAPPAGTKSAGDDG